MRRLGVVLAEQTSRALQAIDLMLRETRDGIRAAGIATDEQFARDLGTEETHRLLVDRLRNLPQADALMLFDSTGRLVNFSRGWPVPSFDVSDSATFQYARAHADASVIVSAPVRTSTDARSATIYLVRRIDGSHGEFLGLIQAAIEGASFEKFYRVVGLWDDVFAAILHHDGTILARYPVVGRETGEKIAAASPWHDLIAAGGGPYHAFNDVGGRIDVGSIHPLQDYPLVVDIATTEDAVLASWRRESIIEAIVASGATIGLLVMFRFVSTQIGRLERQAAQLGQAADALTASEARLQRSQEHLQRAQELAEVGSFERDFRTGEALWSDNHYRIFGVDKATFVNTPGSLLALVHPDDHERFLAFNREMQAGAAGSTLEYRIIRADGTCRQIVRETEALHDARGVVIGMRGTVRDVTQQREQEERNRALELRLQHSQRIEALGTLAGGIAHDLNNTMVPILGLSKLIMRKLPAGSAEHANAEIIHDACKRARDLVQQILAFSRKDAPSKAVLAISDLVRNTLPMLRAAVPTTIAIDCSVEDDLPPVLGDPSHLHQVVVNLVTNAAQAIGAASGRIEIALYTVAGPLRSDGVGERAVCLSVDDSGCGMDQATIGRIFEPFFTTKPVGAGTGLGLAVVHGIIDNHDGRIDVSSVIGRGTRVKVVLPAAKLDTEVPGVLAEAV